MTEQQFDDLKSLIQGNAGLIQENGQRISRAYEMIDRNFEMIGRIYEEHGGRLDRIEGRLTGVEGRLTGVEVGHEQLRDDLRAVAEGVTGNAERIDRLGGRFERFETGFGHF
jgi:hypothetical protein